jgi:hypothetical protein
MNRYLFTLALYLGFYDAWSQDSMRISLPQARFQLQEAFQNDDPARVGLWMDSLVRMSTDLQVALSWDERWLLYYWTESYGNLFEEVADFTEKKRAMESWKRQPPKDSLFEVIDRYIYKERHRYFNSIQTAFLNAEEKAFAVLQLEYLLRLNADDEKGTASKIDVFSQKFPASRFNDYLRSIRPVIYKQSNSGFHFSGGLISASLRGNLDYNFRQAWGGDFTLGYWKKRWNALCDVAILGSKVKRDLYYQNDLWPRDEPVTAFMIGVQGGYDLINNGKLRFFPTIGLNFRGWGPSEPDEEEDPNPPYYANFNDNSLNGVFALNADVKLKTQKKADAEAGKGSYHGFRIKVGLQQRIKSPSWNQLDGNLFFFALHYNFFAYKIDRK